MFRLSAISFLVAFFVLCPFSLNNALAQEKVVLVLDVSGSMWGQIDGTAKISIARDAVKQMVAQWPETREVGLVAYGHRSKGDCNDIETVLPIAPLDRAKIGSAVERLVPRGKTPLSAAVKHAAEELRYTEEKATVILISDGIETCELDPCKVGSELEKLGIDFTAHVIGFDVSSVEDQKGLKCLAENTGGLFIAASNADQLNAALIQTSQAVVVEPEVVKEPEVLPKAELKAPESAVKGTEIAVEVVGEAGIEGWIYLYPKGGDKSLSYTALRAAEGGGYEPSSVRLPARVGEFELRLKSGNDALIASKAIQAIDAEIKIEATKEVAIGTEVSVSMTAPDGLEGYVYLYPTGKEKHIGYDRVWPDDLGGYKVSKIRVPTTAGAYTIKWLSVAEELLAETNFTVIEAAVKLEAAAEAAIGTEVSFQPSGPDGLDGYVHLYAAGRDKSITYDRVWPADLGGYKPGKIRLPAIAGNYDLKWVSNDRDVLAETKVTAVAADISLEAVSEAPSATEVSVTLKGPDGLGGYVHLYRSGRDKSLDYSRVYEGDIQGYKPATIRLPAQPGNYELRFVTNANEVLAKKQINVTAAQVSLTAAEEVQKEEVFNVTIAAPAGIGGYLHVFRVGEEKQLSYSRVYEGTTEDYQAVKITAPKEVGDYVLRWKTGKGEVVAERGFKVVGE
jgi:Ca-activated chloride channel family protein